MKGLLAHGTYVPTHRLARADITAATGTGGSSGTRSVAGYDEDVTSMAVEASRVALRNLAVEPERVYFATTVAPYLDKTNAALVHAALGLRRSALAVDMGGAPRSALGALLAAADADVPTLIVAADLRGGRSGGADEREGGDAAAALVFGPAGTAAPVRATVLASASTTDEILERWRLPGEASSRTWEERFAEHVYGPLAEEAFAAALKDADLTPVDVDHLIVTGLATRAVRQLARSSGVRREAVADDFSDRIGNPGAAQPALLLSAVLDRAEPNRTIALVQLADGATTVLLRTTEHVAAGRARPTAAAQAELTGRSVRYHQMLAWRGVVEPEPPRRPEPDAPAGPPTHRSSGYKHGFHASRCTSCDTVNVPPSRVCFSCGAVDRMEEHAMREAIGTVATCTVDRLAYTPSPPMVAVVVDFDGGGRFRCELTDGGPEDVAIGTRVALTFRRMLTAGGVHNYFWKARPLRAGEEHR